jgi:hypothetical protein
MAQTTGAIVYPTPTDFVRDGAAAMQALAESIDPPQIAGNVAKGFRPLSVIGSALGTNSSQIVGPARIRTVHTTATTDASGYVNIPTGNIFQHVFYCGVTNIGGSLNFDIDKAVTGLAGVLVRVYNPATGTVLGNRAVEYVALIVGI